MKSVVLYFTLLVTVLADKPVSRVQYRDPSQSNINVVPYLESRDHRGSLPLLSFTNRIPTIISRPETLRPSGLKQRSTNANASAERSGTWMTISQKDVAPSLSRRSPMEASSSRSTSTVKQRVAEIERKQKEAEAEKKAKEAQALQRQERAKTPVRPRPTNHGTAAGPSSSDPSSQRPLSRASTSPPRLSTPGSSSPGISSSRISPPRTPSLEMPPAASQPGTSSSRRSPPRTSPSRTSPSRTSPPRTSPPRTSPPRTSPPRTSPPRTSSPRTPPGASSSRTSPPRTSLFRTSSFRSLNSEAVSASRVNTPRSRSHDLPTLARIPSTGSVESFKSTHSSPSPHIESLLAQEQPAQPQLVHQRPEQAQPTLQQPPVQQRPEQARPAPQSVVQQSPSSSISPQQSAQQQPASQSPSRERPATGQTMKRAHSLPLVRNLQSGQRILGEMTKSQPPSPRRGSLTLNLPENTSSPSPSSSPPSPQSTPQTVRRVRVADSHLEIMEGDRRQPLDRAAASSSLPIRSALKGSNNNLAGMVRGHIAPPMPRENPISVTGQPVGSPLQILHSEPQSSLAQVQSHVQIQSQGGSPTEARQNAQSSPADSRQQPSRANSVASTVPGTPRSIASRLLGLGRTSTASVTTTPPNGSIRNGERGRRDPLSTQLSRGLGDISIESERHPGKLLTTGVGTVLSTGIVGGILTGVNYHSVGSITGGSLAGSCVGMTGFMGACLYWKNARTTVEREQIPPEVRHTRGRETAARMVPGFARSSYRYWMGLRNGGSNQGSNDGNNNNNNNNSNNNNNQNQNQDQSQNQAQSQAQTTAVSVSISQVSPNAPHPDPNHPENLVRRQLADFLQNS